MTSHASDLELARAVQQHRIQKPAGVAASQHHHDTSRHGGLSPGELLRLMRAAELQHQPAQLQACARALAPHIRSHPAPVAALLRLVTAGGCGREAQLALLSAAGLTRDEVMACMRQAQPRSVTHASPARGCLGAAGSTQPLPPPQQQQQRGRGARPSSQGRSRSAPTPASLLQPRLGPADLCRGAGPDARRRDAPPQRWLHQAMPAPSLPLPPRQRGSAPDQRRLPRPPPAPPPQRPPRHLSLPVRLMEAAARRQLALLPAAQVPCSPLDKPPQQRQQQPQQHAQQPQPQQPLFRPLSQQPGVVPSPVGTPRAVPAEAVVFDWRLHDVQHAAGAVESPAFKAREQEWRVVAHPQGLNGRGRHLSLYLAAVGSDAQTPFSSWRQRVVFTLSVMQERSRSATLSRSEAHTFDPAEPQYGFTAFAPRAQLLDPGNGFLAPDGSLLIRASLLPLPVP